MSKHWQMLWRKKKWKRRHTGRTVTGQIQVAKFHSENWKGGKTAEMRKAGKNKRGKEGKKKGGKNQQVDKFYTWDLMGNMGNMRTWVMETMTGEVTRGKGYKGDK